MRLLDLSARAELKTAELDEEGVFLIVKEMADYFRDSFSDLKTLNLNNQECFYFEKCLLFVEYYLLHSGKSNFLFFTLFDMIEGDSRFDLTRCRLRLMDCPNKVNNIQNEWRLSLKESILCAKELSDFGLSHILTEQSNDIFFERAISRVFSSFRRMLSQISEENNFMPHLFDLAIRDEIVEKKLALKIMQLSTMPENKSDLFDFVKR